MSSVPRYAKLIARICLHDYYYCNVYDDDDEVDGDDDDEVKDDGNDDTPS